MDGRAFLFSARLLMRKPSEANRRSAVSRGYFAILNEARVALERWGFVVTATADIDGFVVSHFYMALNMDALRVSDALVQLRDNRQQADYSLIGPGIFDDDTEVRRLVRLAEIGIDVLDELESDPARWIVTVAAIRLAFP